MRCGIACRTVLALGRLGGSQSLPTSLASQASLSSSLAHAFTIKSAMTLLLLPRQMGPISLNLFFDVGMPSRLGCDWLFLPRFSCAHLLAVEHPQLLGCAVEDRVLDSGTLVSDRQPATLLQMLVLRPQHLDHVVGAHVTAQQTGWHRRARLDHCSIQKVVLHDEVTVRRDIQITFARLDCLYQDRPRPFRLSWPAHFTPAAAQCCQPARPSPRPRCSQPKPAKRHASL